MKSSHVTMKDVAKLAGVSQATVSYVINGTDSISEEVTARVRSAIETLHYRPNYIAKALKTKQSNLIGIIAPDIVNQYYSRLLQLLEDEFRSRGYEIIITSTSYDPVREKSAIRHLISFNVYGVICLYEFVDKECWELLHIYNNPVVAIEGGSKCAQYGFPTITADNHLGGYMAAQHLLGRGKKRIAYIHQNTQIEALTLRCAGYAEAMKEAGLFRPEDIYTTRTPNNKWAEGKVLGKHLALMPYDGIIASSDVIAVGIMRELLAFGRKIPNDAAIVGYDNVAISELFVPSLTTIAQPIREMCSLAVETLLDRHDLQNRPTIPLLQPTLIIREST